MAGIGSSLRVLTASCGLSLFPLCWLAPANAQTRESAAIRLDATTLDAALTTLARQTGVEIVSTEPGLRTIRIVPLTGTFTVRQALDRLLDHTGYRAIPVRGGSFRVIRAAIAKPPRVRPARLPSSPQPTPEIIVTASKQRIALLRFPGSLTLIAPGNELTPSGANDLDAISRVTPVVETTQLGAGRNKLFVRGIADSSFNGATRSTATVYFGDVELGYSGADPGLKLLDIQRTEVMEGPQGTLYGAGSIGGIVRVTPNPANLTAASGEISAGLLATLGGAPGFDAAGVLNVPIKSGAVGLRMVGYRTRDGGYIDDTERNLDNVNRVDTVGGRAALRVEPGNGWLIDTSVLGQQIDAKDSQYIDFAANGLTRATTLSEPYSNNILLGRLVVTKHWPSGLELLSATGVAQYRSLDLFDVPRAAGLEPAIYRTALTNQLLTQEMRLSRALAGGTSWLIGFSLLRDSNQQDREQGPVGNPNSIIGVTNLARSASGFGELTLAFSQRFSATVGLRLTVARDDAQPSAKPISTGYLSGQQTTRLDPTLALSYLLKPRWSVFARYQSGYRTGGLAVARGIGRVASFEPDEITSGEVGLRLLPASPRALSFSAAGSYSRWTNIQADLISRVGASYTTNLGNARIYTLEGSAAWQPLTGLHGTVAVLYSYNLVSGSIADTSVRDNRRLAQTPSFAANSTLDYRWKSGNAGEWRVGGSAQYVGRAVLGTGDLLDISHNPYLVLGASANWTHDRFGVSLSADNLLNSQADRFSFGNPFTLVKRSQQTPLRPLTVRLGTSFAW